MTPTPISARLRSRPRIYHNAAGMEWDGPDELCEEAAAEIDRLTDALAAAEERAESAEIRLKREAAKHYEQPWTLTKKAALQARCAELEGALRRITSNDCGCTPVCHCNDNETALRVWKDFAQDLARAALAPAGGEGAKHGYQLR